MVVLDLASMAATLAPVLGGEGGSWRRAADLEGSHQLASVCPFQGGEGSRASD